MNNLQRLSKCCEKQDTSIIHAKAMKIILLSLAISTSALSPVMAASTYSITINGPIVVTEFSCDDPCHIDQQEIIGYSGGRITTQVSTNKNGVPATGSHLDIGRSHAGKGIKCVGNCDNKEENTLIIFEHKRTLRNGFKLDIKDRSAHFIFYSVIDTERGPATLLQQSQFRVDRPLIEVELHGHEVEIRSQPDIENLGSE